MKTGIINYKLVVLSSHHNETDADIRYTSEDSSTISADHQPELVFVRNAGVFGNEKFNEAQKVQLKCYCDVMIRQSNDKKLDSLSEEHITELLGWDAEKYRINISFGDA